MLRPNWPNNWPSLAGLFHTIGRFCGRSSKQAWAHKLARKPTKTVTAADRGETTSAMEPMVISESSRHRGRLNQLVFELTTVATAFKASLSDAMVEAVGDLVRSMNCYYSNLIEGHNTHPIDIERALAEDFSADAIRSQIAEAQKVANGSGSEQDIAEAKIELEVSVLAVLSPSKRLYSTLLT